MENKSITEDLKLLKYESILNKNFRIQFFFVTVKFNGTCAELMVKKTDFRSKKTENYLK